MKKKISLFITLLLCLSTIGCGSISNSSISNEEIDLTGRPLRILQFVEQTLGEFGCEDLVYDGINEFCENTGSTLDTFECNYDISYVAKQLDEQCKSGKYDVIVMGFWEMQDFIQQAALKYPDIKFVVFDCTIDFDLYPELKNNVSTYSCKQNSLGFVAGALAALVSISESGLANSSKTIGFVGGGHVSGIDDFLIGYIQGAKYVDSDMKILYSYVGDWRSTDIAKSLAIEQYEAGADVCFGCCYPASFGVCEAAYESKAYALGVDADQGGKLEIDNPLQAEYTISSAIKHFGLQIKDALQTIYDGTIVWGVNNNAGFETGYLEMIESATYKKVIEEEMPEVYISYNEIVAKLLNNEIEVDTAIGASKEYINSQLAKASKMASSN